MTQQKQRQVSMVSITDAAAEKIFKLLQQEKNPDLKLRVSLDPPCGCQDVQFGFYLSEEIEEGDAVIQKKLLSHPEQPSVTVLVDQISLMCLDGAEIDYADSDGLERFLIRNPKEVNFCGSCGGGCSGCNTAH